MDIAIKMMIKKIIFIYLILVLVSSIISFVFFSLNTVINLQVAFWSSCFIVLASFLGYKNNISKRIKLYDTNFQDQDDMDKIDDKYDLYSEINEQENLTKEDIEHIIKEEKSKINLKDSVKNTYLSIAAMSSIFRIIGYILLVVGFFYLKNNSYLEPLSYLIGFLIIPIMALIINYYLKNENYEESY